MALDEDEARELPSGREARIDAEGNLLLSDPVGEAGRLSQWFCYPAEDLPQLTAFIDEEHPPQVVTTRAQARALEAHLPLMTRTLWKRGHEDAARALDAVQENVEAALEEEAWSE